MNEFDLRHPDVMMSAKLNISRDLIVLFSLRAVKIY